MGRNKKLTKATRERMAQTGANYTQARTELLAEEPRPEPAGAAPGAAPERSEGGERILSVRDLVEGAGEVAEVWRTLQVRYTVVESGRMRDAPRQQQKVYALDADDRSWMFAIVGQRVGGVRRIEVEFVRWGRCVIEVQLDAVEPYVPSPAFELISGAGRAAARGDRVRVRYELHLRDPDSTVVATSGDAGVSFVVGAREVEPDLERVVVGMRRGGTRTANLPPSASGPERWLMVELLEVT